MNKKILISAFSVFITLAIYSCYYDHTESLYPQLPVPCDTTNVTYSKSLVQTLSLYCYSCHGPTYQTDGQGIELDTYSKLKGYLPRVIGAINHSAGYFQMPKTGGQLDNCRIQEFSIWQSQGAPNN